jgi:hypothetical protein
MGSFADVFWIFAGLGGVVLLIVFIKWILGL